METDVRESANDCILASRERHGSRGETFQPIYVASPVSSSVELPAVYLWQNLLLHNLYFHMCIEQKKQYISPFKFYK
jgi:hypothetical protein